MMSSPLLLLFPGLMAYAAASDMLTMTIPNRISLTLVAAFIPTALLVGLDGPGLLMHVAAGVTVLVVTFGFFACGWIGGGDAKLAAAVALWFGFDHLAEYLLAVGVGGGALTLFILLGRSVPLPAFALNWTWLDRLHDRRSGVPYGIALAGAAVYVFPHSTIGRALAGL